MSRSYCVYILASQIGGTLYIGVTNDLIRRVHEHKSDVVDGFTKKYGVHRLVYFEQFDDVENAIRREKRLKKWNRAWKIRLIEESNPNWDDLYLSIARPWILDAPPSRGMTRTEMVALKTAEIEKFVARPDAARPVVLIFGADAGLVRERAEKIIKASVDNVDDPFSLVRLEGEDISGDAGRLVDEANTIPLFGGRRAVWVKAGGRNIAPAVEALLAAPPKDCRVVIEAGELRRNAPLRNLCERAKSAVAIACYVDGEREIAQLIDEEMRAASLSIAPEARAALMPLLGGDRQGSRNEIRKLALYAHGKEQVGLEDVIAVVSEASALALDGIVDAMFAGRVAETESQYAKARTAGTAPGTIMSATMRQLSVLHKMRLSVEQGESAGQILDSVRPAIHFRRKPLIETALKAWTGERLVRVMGQLAEAALEVRRQPNLADAIAQRAVLSIASSARRKD